MHKSVYGYLDVSDFFAIINSTVINILGSVVLFTCLRQNSKPREFLGVWYEDFRLY